MQVHNLEADVEGDKGCELINVTVRSINGSKYILLGQDSKVVCIEDIGSELPPRFSPSWHVVTMIMC